MIVDWLKAKTLPIALACFLGLAALVWLQTYRLSTCADRYATLSAGVKTLSEAAEAAKRRAAAAATEGKAKLAEAETRAKAAERALVDRVHKDESCEAGVESALQQWRSRP